MAPIAFEPTDSDEPISLLTSEAQTASGTGETSDLRFEFSSAGDRVPGLLRLPVGDHAPLPLILLQHGARGSKEAPYIETAALPWVRSGVAVATIDFPLHGERTSPKMSKMLEEAVSGMTTGTLSSALLEEFAKQSVRDLQRALDALCSMDRIDGTRIAYAGFSLGAMPGAIFCGLDPRIRGAAFCVGGASFGPTEIDPIAHVGKIAPRPTLFVNAEGDETISRPAADAFYQAAGTPKTQLWFEGTHTELPGAALKAMWEFLRERVAA